MAKNFKGKGKPADDARVTTKTSRQTDIKRGGRSKFRKGSSKSYDEAKDKYNDATSEASNKAKNDAAWYEYSSEMVNAAANINYLNPIGSPYHIDKDYSVGNGTSKIDEAPSLMVLKWTMTPGMADDYVGSPNPSITAPINLQMRSLYTLMQATVTQNLPFASSDLGIHLLFMDSIFSFFAHMQRFYYLYRMYKVLNRTVPEVFLNAYGMTENAIAASDYTIADFKMELLTLEQELNRIFVPKGLAVFDRHYWMNKHVFMDAPDPKAQMYMFIPRATYRYVVPTDTSVSYGAYLERIEIPKFQTIKGMVDFFRSLLTPFYADKDVWNINGYVLRAFPSEQKWMPETLDPAGILEPQFVPEVLTQIHNARVVGNLAIPEQMPKNPKAWTIVQTINDTIDWTPIVPMTGNGMTISQPSLPVHLHNSDVFIDMPMVAPTAADNLVATRLTVQGDFATHYKYDPDDPTAEMVVFRPLVYGTEIINSVSIYNGQSDKTTGAATLGTTRFDVTVYSTNNNLTIDRAGIYWMSVLSHFSMHPLFAVTNSYKVGDNWVDDEGLVGWIDWIGDITNYTVIDKKDLRKLHDAAALGEWLIR